LGEKVYSHTGMEWFNYRDPISNLFPHFQAQMSTRSKVECLLQWDVYFGPTTGNILLVYVQ